MKLEINGKGQFEPIHGMSGKNATPLYRAWKNMISRCYSPSRKKSGRYEDRGITVCEAWRNNFLAFRDWAIANDYEEGLELDRRDNDGNYEPENCRFVTTLINVNNRSASIFVTYRGVTSPISLLLRKLGLFHRAHFIRDRIKRGWTIENAIHTPPLRVRQRSKA